MVRGAELTACGGLTRKRTKSASHVKSAARERLGGGHDVPVTWLRMLGSSPCLRAGGDIAPCMARTTTRGGRNRNRAVPNGSWPIPLTFHAPASDSPGSCPGRIPRLHGDLVARKVTAPTGLSSRPRQHRRARARASEGLEHEPLAHLDLGLASEAAERGSPPARPAAAPLEADEESAPVALHDAARLEPRRARVAAEELQAPLEECDAPVQLATSAVGGHGAEAHDADEREVRAQVRRGAPLGVAVRGAAIWGVAPGPPAARRAARRGRWLRRPPPRRATPPTAAPRRCLARGGTGAAGAAAAARNRRCTPRSGSDRRVSRRCRRSSRCGPACGT